jgi:LmbE family N-acetylglucosaminyl deacetylase
MTVLVIAAHPDDEALGCGGTIARHARLGETVDIVFVSDGETSRPGAGAADIEGRQDAARAAAKALGARPPVFLGFPDNALDTVRRLTIVQALERAVAQIWPTVVYTHHAGDLNVDHQITAAAALTAFRPQPGSSVRGIYGFEVLSSTHWAGPEGAFNPVRFVDVSADLDAKRAALACYEGEMRRAPHARSAEAVAHLAGFRGMTHGLAAAEAFTVLREIVA